MANAVAQPDSSDSVGFTFVELMFAVAVGDAAIQIGKVMQAVRLTGDYFLKDIRQVSPSIAHLLLAVLVIACSSGSDGGVQTPHSLLHGAIGGVSCVVVPNSARRHLSRYLLLHSG